jgi:hypothetical protein
LLKVNLSINLSFFKGDVPYCLITLTRMSPKPGIPVKVRRKASPSTLYTAMVSHTGAAIQRLPDRLAPLSTLPLWGLSVHITLPNELYPKPGEAFEVIS